MKSPLNRFTLQSCGYNYKTVPIEVFEEMIALAFLLATSAYNKQILPAENADPYIKKALDDLQHTALEFLETAEIIEHDPKLLH